MDYIKDIGEYNFTTVQGATEVFSLLDWRVDGVAWSLANAQEVRVDFRRNPRTKDDPELSLTAANGGLTISGNNMDMNFGANTLKLAPGHYHYDVLVVKGGLRYTYVRGIMTLDGVVTK